MDYTYNNEEVSLVPQTGLAKSLLKEFFKFSLKRDFLKDGIIVMSVSELRDFFETMGGDNDSPYDYELEWFSDDPDIIVYHDDEKVYDILSFLYD